MEFAASLNQSEEETPLKSLQRLNLEYVRSVEQRDVAWFDANLAPDFMNSNPDGALVDRAGFLAQIGRGAGVSSITAHDILRAVGTIEEGTNGAVARSTLLAHVVVPARRLA